MDNTYARYLVRKGTVSIDVNEAMNHLRDGHMILIRQARSEKNHVPYRVARHYSSFFNAHRSRLNDEQKAVLSGYCNDLIEFIPKLKLGRIGSNDVDIAKKELQSVIAATAT